MCHCFLVTPALRHQQVLSPSKNGKSDHCDQMQILWSLKTELSEACLWVHLSLPVLICLRNAIPSSGVGCVLCFPEVLLMQLLP